MAWGVTSRLHAQRRSVCVSPQNYVKAMRLFVGDPVWTPYNRPSDHLEARTQYLEFLAQSA